MRLNGVINIITKESQGHAVRLVTAGAGTEERASGSARYGGTVGKTLTGSTKYFNWGPSQDSSGITAHDGWDRAFAADFARIGRLPDRFLDLARRHLPKQVRGDFDRSVLSFPLFEHVPNKRKLTAEQTFWAGGITARKVLRTTLQMYYDNTTFRTTHYS